MKLERWEEVLVFDYMMRPCIDILFGVQRQALHFAKAAILYWPAVDYSHSENYYQVTLDAPSSLVGHEAVCASVRLHVGT